MYISERPQPARAWTDGWGVETRWVGEDQALRERGGAGHMCKSTRGGVAHAEVCTARDHVTCTASYCYTHMSHNASQSVKGLTLPGSEGERSTRVGEGNQSPGKATLFGGCACRQDAPLAGRVSN
jgi:hypothetical protein